MHRLLRGAEGIFRRILGAACKETGAVSGCRVGGVGDYGHGKDIEGSRETSSRKGERGGRFEDGFVECSEALLGGGKGGFVIVVQNTGIQEGGEESNNGRGKGGDGGSSA